MLLEYTDIDDWQRYDAFEVNDIVSNLSPATDALDSGVEPRTVYDGFGFLKDEHEGHDAFAEEGSSSPQTSASESELGSCHSAAATSSPTNGAVNGRKIRRHLRGKAVVRKSWTPAEEERFHKALARFGPKDIETDPVTGRVSVRLGSVLLPPPNVLHPLMSDSSTLSVLLSP